mmetsp:Transcript_103075/g.204648  ORF Transcript_103075/g.204648 Transcript_103075/m.204648 type:complete len:174 (+) Transcript_103075:82-603(+)
MSSMSLLSASPGCNAVRILVLLVTVYLTPGHRILHTDKVEQHGLNAQNIERVQGEQQPKVQNLAKVHDEQRQANLQSTWETASRHSDHASHTAETGTTKQMVDAETQVEENAYTRIFSWQGMKDAVKAFTSKDCLSFKVFEYNTDCHRAMPLWTVVVLLATGLCCCICGCILF